MNPNFAEIQYYSDAGIVHSDIDPVDRRALHANLDEWLNSSGGTGFFYIGDVTALRSALAEE